MMNTPNQIIMIRRPRKFITLYTKHSVQLRLRPVDPSYADDNLYALSGVWEAPEYAQNFEHDLYTNQEEHNKQRKDLLSLT